MALSLLVVVLVLHRGGPIDQAQMSAGFASLLSGHLGSVYTPQTGMTSPPGFLLLVAPLAAALGADMSTRTPQLVVGMLSAAFLAATARRLGHQMCSNVEPARLLLLSATVVLSAPTLFAIDGAYHPEDLVAAGFVLLAVADVGTGHARRAGLALGAALLTRQWALLVAIPVLLAAGPAWRRVSIPAAVLCGVALAPFAILEPAGLLRALEARSVSIGVDTLWRYIGLPKSLAFAVSRVSPFAAGAAAAMALGRRWRDRPPDLPQIVAAAAVFAGLRVVLDTASWPYYALPLFAPLAVLGLCHPDRRRRAGSLVAVLGLEVVLLWAPVYERSGAGSLAVVASALFVSEVGAVAWAWKMASGRPAILREALLATATMPVLTAIVTAPEVREMSVGEPEAR